MKHLRCPDKYYINPEYIDDEDSIFMSRRHRIVEDSEAFIQGEVNSRYKQFTIDRYVDGIDISTKEIQIQYNNEGNGGNCSPINVGVGDKHIKIGWVVPGGATVNAGSLDIFITASDDAYLYKTETLTYTVNESKSFNSVADANYPEYSSPTSNEYYSKLNEVMAAVEDLQEQFDSMPQETTLGCVLRPQADTSDPWVLFSDAAHESSGITNIQYNSDGTLQLYFDKSYNKIRCFNAYPDEMMKIYGLDVGASVGLNSAKLFLISNLVFGFVIGFSLDSGIQCSSGFVESCEWVEGVGAKVKFKNVPKQTPNTAQVSTTNTLNLSSTCSITGNREITMKFYKPDGTLVTDITGNWNVMVDVNYRGLCDFNALSIYDSDVLSSMALMFEATMNP